MSKRLIWVTCVFGLMTAGCIAEQPVAACERSTIGSATYCQPDRARGIHETGFRCVDWPPGFACPADLPTCNDSSAGAFCADRALPPEEAEQIGAALADQAGTDALTPDASTPDTEPPDDFDRDATPAPIDDAEMAHDGGPPTLGPRARMLSIDGSVHEPVPSPGIYIKLEWQAPEDPSLHPEQGVDLDLRLRHPNAGDAWDGPWVCSHRESQPAWSDPSDPERNPQLMNDENHSGIEEIWLRIPENGVNYGIAADVFAYGDPVTQDPPTVPVTATVHAFVNNSIAGAWEMRFTATSQRFWLADIDACHPQDDGCERVQHHLEFFSGE